MEKKNLIKSKNNLNQLNISKNYIIKLKILYISLIMVLKHPKKKK